MKLKGIRLSMRPWIPLGITILMFVLSSCHSQPSSSELASQTKNLGVYAFTGTQLTEVSTYGVYLEDPVLFRFKDPIAKVPSVEYFVVNIPNVNIVESHLYSFSDPRRMQWSIEQMEHRGPGPLKTNIEAIGNGVYKMTLAEKPKSRSFVSLWLKLSMGSRDRLYAVELSE